MKLTCTLESDSVFKITKVRFQWESQTGSTLSEFILQSVKCPGGGLGIYKDRDQESIFGF